MAALLPSSSKFCLGDVLAFYGDECFGNNNSIDTEMGVKIELRLFVLPKSAGDRLKFLVAVSCR